MGRVPGVYLKFKRGAAFLPPPVFLPFNSCSTSLALVLPLSPFLAIHPPAYSQEPENMRKGIRRKCGKESEKKCGEELKCGEGVSQKNSHDSINR